MVFSIESPLARSWRFEDIGVEAIVGLSSCTAKQARAHITRLATPHREPACVAARLATLPAPALGILSVLASHGGKVGHVQNFQLEAQRFGFAVADVDRSLGALLVDLLVVPLQTVGGDPVRTLVDPVGRTLIGHVLDLDVPRLATAPLVPTHDGGRTVLAVCAMLDHVELTLTQAGMFHRAGLTRFAKQLALTEPVLEAALGAGLEAELLCEGDDRVVRPVWPWLIDAAHGGYRSPALAAPWLWHPR